ncbi:MAG: isopentenyl-diphosphate Delta-isomerase [Gemmatimonadales bacterium]|nr:MAG: isopentenyl-diphosphate Delta-isomerase [Gemmatimonadales bacterium]
MPIFWFMHSAEADESVILVDAADRPIGSAPKLDVHRDGRLHRAFSVFVFDPRGRLLLQRRALGKYHSGGLWSNTCCGHPRPGEATAAAAARRLREEMGFGCSLQPAGTIVYRAALAEGLWEHEYDHLFTGRYNGDPRPDPSEVAEWRWVEMNDLLRELGDRPSSFTVWFEPALREVLQRIAA